MRLTIGIEIPSSTGKELGIHYFDSGVGGVESRIQKLSWMSFYRKGKFNLRMQIFRNAGRPKAVYTQ